MGVTVESIKSQERLPCTLPNCKKQLPQKQARGRGELEEWVYKEWVYEGRTGGSSFPPYLPSKWRAEPGRAAVVITL